MVKYAMQVKNSTKRWGNLLAHVKANQGEKKVKKNYRETLDVFIYFSYSVKSKK